MLLYARNNGVIIAEQLAPLLNPSKKLTSKSAIASSSSSSSSSSIVSSSSGVIVDESYVLPALIKFGGDVSVTPSGDIIYSFPVS